MDFKILLLIFILLALTLLGCVQTKVEEEEKEVNNYTISDFSSVKIGLTYYEVIELVGEPTDSIGSGIVWERYKLDEGCYVNLLFLGDSETLIDMRIVDYINDREFVLNQNDN